MSLPRKIGLVSNAENRAALADADEDADFPGLKGLLSFDGKTLEWTSEGDTPFTAPFLDPEVIRAYGTFNCKESGYYIFQSNVSSEREQPLEFRRIRQTVQRVFLNGAEVNGAAARLQQGQNRLILIYHTGFSNERRFSNYNGEHAGCFLRLVKPGTTERIANVRFEPPIR